MAGALCGVATHCRRHRCRARGGEFLRTLRSPGPGLWPRIPCCVAAVAPDTRGLARLECVDGTREPRCAPRVRGSAMARTRPAPAKRRATDLGALSQLARLIHHV